MTESLEEVLGAEENRCRPVSLSWVRAAYIIKAEQLWPRWCIICTGHQLEASSRLVGSSGSVPGTGKLSKPGWLGDLTLCARSPLCGEVKRALTLPPGSSVSPRRAVSVLGSGQEAFFPRQEKKEDRKGESGAE